MQATLASPSQKVKDAIKRLSTTINSLATAKIDAKHREALQIQSTNRGISNYLDTLGAIDTQPTYYSYTGGETFVKELIKLTTTLSHDEQVALFKAVLSGEYMSTNGESLTFDASVIKNIREELPESILAEIATSEA